MGELLGPPRWSSTSTKPVQVGLPGASESFWAASRSFAEFLGPPRWSSTSTKSLQLRSFWALPGGAVQAQSLCKRSFKRRDLRSRPHSDAILSQAAAPVWPSLEQQETSGFPLTPFCNTPAPDMPQLSKSEQTRQPASQPASQPAGQPAGQPTPRRLNCGRDHNLT